MELKSYKYLKEFLNPNTFQINIKKVGIYITNYQKILTLSNNKVIIKLDISKIIMEGNNFSLQKLKEGEVLIKGTLRKLEIIYE